jgi:hypothetical protein
MLPRQADRSPMPCLGRRQAGPGGRDAHAAYMRCRSRLRAGCRLVRRRSGMSSCSNALGAPADTPGIPPHGLGHQRRRLLRPGRAGARGAGGPRVSCRCVRGSARRCRRRARRSRSGRTPRPIAPRLSVVASTAVVTASTGVSASVATITARTCSSRHATTGPSAPWKASRWAASGCQRAVSFTGTPGISMATRYFMLMA